jgi:hypothetical protein
MRGRWNLSRRRRLVRQSAQAEPEYHFGFTGWKSMDGGTGMRCLEVVNLPRSSKSHAGAMEPGNDLRPQQVAVCRFELRHADEFCWYECAHCSACGCPSFPLSDLKEMPSNVLEHLQLHAELCSKLER